MEGNSSGPTSISSRITSIHLRRKAVIYLRQSSARQVEINTGSQLHQRSQIELARQYGWRDDRIEMLDDDLGLSGTSADQRPGWRRMLDLVSANLVGAIFVVDISRLARNTLDLLNFITTCIRHDVLLIVGGRIMDPRDSQDLFFSQITAAVAEYENRLRATRMQEARRNKARRGEIVSHLPVGWVKGRDGAYDYDPETKDVISLVIQTFWQERSVRRTVRALNQNGIQLPSRAPNANRLVWRQASFDAVSMFLHHPAYAGTYVYGRSALVPGAITSGGNKVSKSLPESAWIKTPNALPPYLSEEDQASIKAFLKRKSRPPTGVSHSPALFQGLLRCGNCGVLLHVKYEKN